jgi:formylglycine-generating enzyme required for sulfatase activity
VSSNESDPSSQPLLPLDHKPITEIEIGASSGRANKTRISKGGAAIRSTAIPGGKSTTEGPQKKDLKPPGNARKPESPAPAPTVLPEAVPATESEPEAKLPAAGARPSKPFERKPHTKVFVPFGGVLAEEKKSGPSAGAVLLVVLLLGIAGWGYSHFAGNKKKTSAEVEISKRGQEEPAASPEPSQASTPAAGLVDAKPALPEPSPTASPSLAAASTPPEVSSTGANVAAVPEQSPQPTPEPAKPKIRVEPLHIPEETGPVVKAAAKVPQIIAKAQSALDENEKSHQLRLQSQEKADAALKEAQAAAEKANADLLLKQAEAGDAAKAVAETVAVGEEKKRAIQQAQAEMARFQAVASQIAWLKQERATETEAPTSETKIADPTMDPAAIVEDLPEAPSTSSTNAALKAPSATAATANSNELVNSLGMKFILVGDIRVSVWLTRVQDYEAYADAVGLKGAAWKQPGFAQTATHPVVNVSWKDANAFCRWLTAKEHKEGVLPNDLVYRLPTDSEWSLAAGLPYEKGRSAQLRDKDVPGFYPWGNQWPPNPGSGNFTGEETGTDPSIKGFNDGCAWTSPVGSFLANAQGLYDMGGNASQWCLDWWNEEKNARVIRGSSWANSATEESLLLSARLHATPESAANSCGFRCVISAEGYQ